jgi:SAM-dependent methyltransferase
VARLSDRIAAGYRGAGSTWATDAALVYGPLARHLIAKCPLELSGCLVLDAGAGTGLAGDVASEAGARVIAADRQADMLLTSCRRESVVADVDLLPFASGAFDVTVAAFVLNHLSRPALALREFARVTRPTGMVLTSTFSSARTAAKSLVDDVIADHGWVAPPWYVAMHRCTEAVDTVERVVALARRSGLNVISATETEVDVGLSDPALVVRSRLGMPQIAPFLTSLTPQRRALLVRDAEAAVRAGSTTYRPTVIELVAAIKQGGQRARQ